MKKYFLVFLFILISSLASAQMNPFTPPGSLQMFGGLTAPTGWLICDGSIVNIASYPRLYNALGTAYNRTGETPGTNFRIPDMRGIFPIGVGQSGPYGVDYVGVRGGYAQDTAQKFRMPILAYKNYGTGGNLTTPDYDLAINNTNGNTAYSGSYMQTSALTCPSYQPMPHTSAAGEAYGLVASSYGIGGGVYLLSSITGRFASSTVPASLGVNYIIKY